MIHSLALLIGILAALTTTSVEGRTWTDTTGKFSLEADFVEVKDGKVVLKKPDGAATAVLLEKLSWADRGFAATQGSLLVMPDVLKWSADAKKDLDDVVGSYDKDPVSAYLTFNNVLREPKAGAKKASLSSEQSKWLKGCAEAAKSAALKVLQRDFAQAVEKGDLRSAFLVSVVADEVQDNALGDSKPAIAALKSKTFSPPGVGSAIWEISNVTGTFLTGSYSEDSFDKLTVTPEKGYKLLRVTAKIKNASGASDVPYAPWTLNSWQRLSLELDKKKRPGAVLLGGPHRITMSEHVFVLTSGGDMISVVVVPKDCTTLRGTLTMTDTKNPKQRPVYGGSLVASGSEFDLDAIFTVADKISDLRLLILGSSPKPINIPAN